MQTMYACFLFMTFFNSVVLKDSGVNVIPGHTIQTTTPLNITAGDFTSNKTGNQFKNLTENDKRENSAHSENNLFKETNYIKTIIVAISVSLTIISVLSISLVVFLKKRGFCKRTQMQEIESYEMTEPLNN